MAGRIWRAICGERWAIRDAIKKLTDADSIGESLCTLGRILLNLRAVSLGKFTELLDEGIRAVLTSRGAYQEVPIRRANGLNDDAYLFLPQDLVSEAISHITSNLSNYAFPAASHDTRCGKVEIVLALQDTDDGDEFVSVIIRDNGVPPHEPIIQGEGGQRLNSAMDIFGGAFPIPTLSGVSGWSTEQYFEARLW